VIAEKEFLSPGMPPGAGPDATRPATPPLLVRQGGGPFSVGRSHRRRRSADPLPPPPVPAEMPYDTVGRVAFLSVAPPPDVRPDPPAEAPALAAPRPGSRLEGWTAVALAAAVIVVLFLVGLGITR
jgi:hypothetical protein